MDTSARAEQVQLDLMRRAGPTGRAALAFRLSSSMLATSRRAVALRHPELDAQGVMLLWAELHYGAALADAVRRYLRSRA